MKKYPEGISEGDLRSNLGIPTNQLQQFGRRRRDLYNWYDIASIRKGREFLYVFKGARKEPRDANPVDRKLRAEVLAQARGRCQMCGRSVDGDGIRIEVDHKMPREWGGRTEIGNLWALCHECNQGKKAHFESLGVDDRLMKQLSTEASVHVRIGELLKAFGKAAAPSYLIELVANQSEWRKRLRELRYPVIGWKIAPVQTRTAGKRAEVGYQLLEHRNWPPDPTGAIREYERERERQRRLKKR